MENLIPLVIKAQSNDEEAMTQLIMQFDNLLLKLSRNYNGSIDEDCYQILAERFIKAVRRFDTERI
ncbi:helix-turn-helix domain-containing protein [Enterococcus faecium]|uniref:helix-turn-helix domain-containing protein n=1 Tax=Enterococcus faecium TaxID=1352 RepID=UPI0010FC1C18|nr:helix-turn-helix domain-containing protein [Enterococcus faecium]QCS45667.1 helix-turn-helix domain-containing protein [Enterococcus faecium]